VSVGRSSERSDELRTIGAHAEIVAQQHPRVLLVGSAASSVPHRRLSMPGPRTGRPAATSPRWQGDSGRSTGALRPLGCIQTVDLFAEDVAVTGVPGELLDKGEQCPSHADASLAGIVVGVVEVEAGRDLT
jgi:hypothetical protein